MAQVTTAAVCEVGTSAASRRADVTFPPLSHDRRKSWSVSDVPFPVGTATYETDTCELVPAFHSRPSSCAAPPDTVPHATIEGSVVTCAALCTSCSKLVDTMRASLDCPILLESAGSWLSTATMATVTPPITMGRIEIAIRSSIRVKPSSSADRVPRRDREAIKEIRRRIFIQGPPRSGHETRKPSPT